MSRHTLTSKNPVHEVTVGWDKPLNTFFVVVELRDPPDDLDGVVFANGQLLGDVTSAEEICDIAAKYANFDRADLIATLNRDRRVAPFDPNHFGTQIARQLKENIDSALGGATSILDDVYVFAVIVDFDDDGPSQAALMKTGTKIECEQACDAYDGIAIENIAERVPTDVRKVVLTIRELQAVRVTVQ